MSENRIEQIYDMVTQLIKIVGNTTVAIEELREGQIRLEKKQDILEKNQENIILAIEELREGQIRLEKRQENLEKRQENLEKNQENLEKRQESLEKNQEKFKLELLEKLDTLDNAVDYLAYKFLEHDMKIFGQKHKKAASD